MIDERSAGFVALGMAKASGRPVAVTCTSGTAAANLHPAVVEAWEARVPLIVLTADRPPELREVGAGQAIDQIKLYGSSVKWFVEVGTHPPGRETAIHHRALGCRAYWTAASGRPGPGAPELPAARAARARARGPARADDWEGRPGGRPWTELREHASAPHADDVHELAERIASTPRGAIVCGPSAEEVAEPAARLAAVTGWPLLAEPTSGVRCGEHDRSHVVAHYDVLLRAEGFASAHRARARPARRRHARPRSRCAPGSRSQPQVLIDPHAGWHEPTRRAELILASAAAPTLDALALGDRDAERASPIPDWLASWRSGRRARAGRARRVARRLRAQADRRPRGGAARRGARSGSAPRCRSATSRPTSRSPTKRLRVLANRGANGIDGVVSSALGAALATRPARPGS